MNYTDLRTLANCATQAINASKRYGRSSNSVLATDCVTKLANDKPFASAESENWNPHNRPQTRNNGRQTQRYFPQHNFSRSRGNMAQQHLDFSRNFSQPNISSLLFILDLYPFNVEDILLLDLEIFISFNNPDQLYLANSNIFATITDVSVKILILVKVLTANNFSNYSAIML